MSIEISLPWAPIKALAHLAGDKDIRKWCMGVWIDSSGPTRAVIATNGGALGVFRTGEPSDNTPPVFVPGHIIKACKGFGPLATVKIDDTKHVSIESFGTRHYWADEDHKLPDWRRVLPKNCTGIAQQFDVELLTRFAKARKDLGGKPAPSAVRITHNGRESTAGGDGALVTLLGFPDFVGVVMCLRMAQQPDPLIGMPKNPPAWVFGRAEETCDLV